MPAPEEIKKLVQRYKDHRDQYKSSGYKETELRREFLDPLFTILGWDVDNKQGHAEQYKEVVHEKSLDVEGDTRAPDYSFRIGGTTKFFVEAKKPSVDITSDKKPAFQLKRYAWSAKLPLSILTNFEDLIVYDCRYKPDKNDTPDKPRILYISFDELEERWDELCAIFTKEAILKGSFDKYAQEKKRGTSEVDSEILKDIESWREELAKNIAINNPDLTIEAMNFAVGRLIDRILFLRICEDRGTEPENQLHNIYETKTNIYRHLLDVFQLADAKYNSGLFHFTHDKARSTKADRITPNIKVDDKVLASIIWDLYYPNSPYQFDVIPADILGQVYEQFLGKVIRLTAGHHAKVEEKPEVKKAGGVYYTPTYIVDYIVENTVVKLCEGKTPEEMKKLKILDPACGSGSFLIVAYKRLMDKHLEWYTANNPKKHKDEVFQNHKNAWQLTLQEKKKILLGSIHGVDIDSQAVEVTKLNLLLKALEGESRESIDNVQKWFREPALPDLGSNIKCGNSLIDFDIIDHLQDLSEDERDTELARINPFNWQEEFSGIMKAGGFDAVVGNPPYVNFVALPKLQREYFKRAYKSCKNKSDLYSFFVERAYNLKNVHGKVGFIVPHTWLATDSFVLLRTLLFKDKSIEEICEMGHGVFKKVIVSTVILILSANNDYLTIRNNNFSERFKIPTELWNKEPYHIDLYWNPIKHNLFVKMKAKSKPMGEILKFSRGIKTSDDKRFISKVAKNKDYKKVYRGKNIKAYQLNWAEEYIWYRPDLMQEKVGCLPHTKDFFEVPEKIITQRVNSSMQLLVTYDDNQNYFLDTTNVSRYDSWDELHSLKYLCGILNSRIINYWYCDQYRMPTIGGYELHSIPIRAIDFSNKEDVARHDKMVKLVERMLKLHKDLKEAGTPEKEERIQREIRATDVEIDRLVYELYGLTPDEIGVVEGEA